MNVLVIKKVIAITSVVKLYSARRDDVVVHLNNFTSILKVQFCNCINLLRAKALNPNCL